ncbi:tyrosine-type DNA invertase [Serratia aquatilis]|uniref:Tyrosine-type DNA invertase n=1 Tax=Serratia aquatilis TaxID=1737515 RepID=A0ABV6EG87_9GAMM
MRTRKYLNEDEVKRLLASVSQGDNYYRDKCMILMCYIHGFRVSELTALKLSDIDLVNRKVHINRLKNGFSVQHPLHDSEIELIKAWLAQRSTYLNADSEWLFLSRHGTRISRQRFYRAIKGFGEAAGISVVVTPHMLRHSCGYALAEQGVDTRLIQDYLGHKNIRHTVLYTASNAARFKTIVF